MTNAARSLLEQALKLSAEERAGLARELLDSLVGEDEVGELEVEPDFAAELERRATEGPKPGERWPTGDEVVAEALRRARERPAQGG